MSNQSNQRKISNKDMVIILKAKVRDQCDEKNNYIRECEKLENTEWELTAYMYKYEKVETIEKLLKLTDKHQNIVINSSLLNRLSVVREEEKKTHTYFNHYDPVTGGLVLQFKKTDASIKAGKDKPRYYDISVGYTAHMEILKPFLKTEFTEKDLGCVKSATSMFKFRPPPKVVPVAIPVAEPVVEPVVEPVKAKKVKKVMIDDDPVLPNEPQFNPATKKIEKVKKAKKVKKVMIDDDPILPNEPQMFIPLSLNGRVTIEQLRAYEAQQNIVIKTSFGRKVLYGDLLPHEQRVYIWIMNEFPKMNSDVKRYIRIACDMEGMDLLTDDDTGDILDEAYYYYKDNFYPTDKEYIRTLEEFVTLTPDRNYSKND